MLLSGYLRLTSNERTEFINELNAEIQRVQKGLVKEGRLDGQITLGPLARGCPCCGR